MLLRDLALGPPGQQTTQHPQGPLGQAIRVNTQTGGNRFSLSAATTSGPEGDTAFFVWNDDTKTSADQSGQAVKGRVLAMPAKGF